MEAVAQLVEQRNVLFSLIPSIEWRREELLRIGSRWSSVQIRPASPIYVSGDKCQIHHWLIIYLRSKLYGSNPYFCHCSFPDLKNMRIAKIRVTSNHNGKSLLSFILPLINKIDGEVLSYFLLRRPKGNSLKTFVPLFLGNKK